MSKLNFHRYLILRIYATCEIRENLMHVKNVFYSIAEYFLFHMTLLSDSSETKVIDVQ